jgi:sigma-B regulation protein RsbU (phosphoserine phosphatase)
MTDPTSTAPAHGALLPPAPSQGAALSGVSSHGGPPSLVPAPGGVAQAVATHGGAAPLASGQGAAGASAPPAAAVPPGAQAVTSVLGPAGGESKATRHKAFYRKLDALLGQIGLEQGIESMLTAILVRVTDDFAEVTGIVSGRLYKEDGDDYVVVRSFGAKGKAILGFRVPKTYTPFRSLAREKTGFFAADDPRLDRQLEGELGVGHFVAFYVGTTGRYIAAFGIGAQADVEEALLTINTLRYAIQHRIRELTLEGQLKEARSIQMSMLPEEPPEFPGFELTGRSIPAEEVGGDIYDFIPIDDSLLGVAIGDASGHGLPAALQARDAVTGLRMGVQRDLKITSVLHKLNNVIHYSGLTSRFVSLFYGELERSGTFVYVNAGHNAGLMLRADGTRSELGSTGIVLGPVEDAAYRRNFVFFQPGDTMVLYTDGMIERLGPAGEYGLDRLEKVAREGLSKSLPLPEVLASLFDDTFRFGDGMPWSDDATVVMVRRLPA